MGAIACVRSLGRAGFPVHACATATDALGLHSRYAARAVVSPSYADSSFGPWLRDYIAQHQIRAIIPSEGLFLAIHTDLEEFTSLLPTTSRPDILRRGFSKIDAHEALTTDARVPTVNHIPPSLIVSADRPMPDTDSLRTFGTPLYIKVDATYGGPGASAAVYRASTLEAAEARLRRVLATHRKALVQSHVPGQGVGAFFLLWNGNVVAEFMHRRLHEVPYTGGVSSLRESWWHQAIRDDALSKLQALSWQGVAMMEYRWDPHTGAFYFIELNGRFWGSLHLALYAGVDFPRMLADSFFGRPVESVSTYPLGLRCRNTIPQEIQHVWSKLRDRTLPASDRLWSILEFALLTLDPRVKSDLLFPGDTHLFWRRAKRFLMTLA